MIGKISISKVGEQVAAARIMAAELSKHSVKAPNEAVAAAGSPLGLTLAGRTAALTHVLVVDEDVALRGACVEIATRSGFQAHAVETLEQARLLLRGQSVDILLLDLKSPSHAGLDLLEELRSLEPDTAIVVMTAQATVHSAVEAMRSGATDFLMKPFAMDELKGVLDRAKGRRTLDVASRELRERMRTAEGMGKIIGRSPEMEKLYRILAKVAQTAHPVLVLGESGTGKELVARAIHTYGPHAERPFLPVDCGAIVPTLMESELFGYVKGAFTGANRSKDGLLVAAEDGTVFLDEIGELPLDLQAKLLRALQEREVRPVGATHRLPIRCRIVAATNRDLAAGVEQGRFRKDLYYRLNVVNLRIPALRDRRQDIPLLIAHFLDRIGREHKREFSLSDEALRVACDYQWPGNVRELENALQRACSLSSSNVIQLNALLNTQINDHWEHTRTRILPPALPGEAAPKPVTPLAEQEKQAILETIRQFKGDKLTAAKMLGIGKTTLYRKLKEYGIGEA